MSDRDLNDYESMLAKSTCCVGIRIALPSSSIMAGSLKSDDDSLLRRAWERCRLERNLLQVRLVPQKENNMGKLGMRYAVEKQSGMDSATVDKDLFVMRFGPVLDDDEFLQQLQTLGTTKPNPERASYSVLCHVEQENFDDKGGEVSVCVFLSLCHALSDGPGSFFVIRSFLLQLARLLQHEEQQIEAESHPQPLIDLQRLLLGSDYGASISTETKPLYDKLDLVTSALKAASSDPLSLPQIQIDNVKMPFLIPEAMQPIPSESTDNVPVGVPTQIKALHFNLSVNETKQLLANGRHHGVTVQGMVSAAALLARLKLLYHEDGKNSDSKFFLPIAAAIQVPVDTRKLLTQQSHQQTHFPDLNGTCLCGSAGLWHLIVVNEDDDFFSLAHKCTQAIRGILSPSSKTSAQTSDKNKEEIPVDDIVLSQPKEWLRRLLHNPATLPPYSLMASSIGIVPIDASYNDIINVSKVAFFGGALRQDNDARQLLEDKAQQPLQKGTMMHLLTFDGQLGCTMSYTWPGVSNNFANKTIRVFKSVFLAMAATDVQDEDNSRGPLLSSFLASGSEC